jgi:hypothetical protein
MSEQIMEHIGEDGAFTDGFAKATITHLGEGYQDSKSLDDVHNIGALAKIAIDSRRANTKLTEAAATAIQRPGENATDEEKAAHKKLLRNELGASAKVEDYNFGKPLNLPEGLPWNEEGAKKWAEFFSKNSIPVEIAREIVTAVHTEAIETFNKLQVTNKESFDATVKVITDKNQPDAIKEMGRLAFKYLDTWGSDEAKEAIKGMFEMPENFEEWSKRGIPPAQVAHMAKVAKGMQSGTTKAGDKTGAKPDADADFVAMVNAKSPALQPAAK